MTSKASLGGHPIHLILIPFPIGLDPRKPLWLSILELEL